MQKLIKNLLKDKSIFLAILTTLGILYLSLIRMPKIDVEITFFDKILHTFAYFVLGSFWLITFNKTLKMRYIVAISCIIFGIIIEALQHTQTMYRTGDYKDALANTLGVVLALVIFSFFKKS